MTESGALKYSRLIVFINTGCTKLLRAVLLQYVHSSSTDPNNPLTLDDFLHQNRNKIYTTPYGKKRKIESYQETTLFPGFGVRTDIDKWDLQLLALIILEVACSLPYFIQMDIREIKKIRNFLCHVGVAHVEDATYNSEMATLRIIFQRMSGYINDEETRRELSTVINNVDFEISESVYQESLKRLRNWCESEKNINDKLDCLMQGQEQIIALLQRNISLLPENSKSIEIPETDVILDVKNCTADKELFISRRLVSLLDPKLRNNMRLTRELSEEGMQDVNNAVQQAILELLSSGKEVVEAQHGCVILKIRCLSFEVLQELWYHTVNGTLTAIFKRVEKALRAEFPEVELGLYMTENEWWRSVYEIVTHLTEHFHGTPASDILDTCHITELLGNSEDNILSQIKSVKIKQPTLKTGHQSEHDDSNIRIMVSIAAKSQTQREHIIESIENGSFNEKLGTVAEMFMTAYETKPLSIKASVARESSDTDIESNKESEDDETKDSPPDNSNTRNGDETGKGNEGVKELADESNIEKEETVADSLCTDSEEVQEDNADIFRLRGFVHVMEKILSYLDAESLSSAEQVCKDWYTFISSRTLWPHLVKRMTKTDALCGALARRRGWNQSKMNILTLDRQYLKMQLALLKESELSWQLGRYNLKTLQCLDTEVGGVYSLQADDEKIVTGGRDSLVKIWDNKTFTLKEVLNGHKGSVLRVVCDDRVILSSAVDDSIRIWDAHTGKFLNQIGYQQSKVLSMKFIGNVLVTGSQDGSMGVWDVYSATDVQLRKILVGHQAAVNSVDFDDHLIVSGSGDRTVKVWNIQTCEYERTLLGHRRGVACVKMKENLAVSGGSDETISVWDIKKGTCIRVLAGCESFVRCLDFDHKRIVSGTYDGMIRIWDMAAALDESIPDRKLCLHTLIGHSDKVFCIQLDDFQIVSGSNDGHVLIWDFLDVEGEETNTSALIETK